MNPALWLVRAARRAPTAPALLTGATLEADYRAFAAAAASIGGALRHRFGVAPGDRVGLFMTNRTAYLEALFGVWMTGAVAVPVNAKLHPKEAAWILEDAGAACVFVSRDVGDGLRAVAPSPVRAMIDVDAPGFDAMRRADPLSEPAAMGPEALAWLFYTSGTTGRPKGVMIPTRSLSAMTLCYGVDVDPARADDCALYAAPLSHGAGLYSLAHVLAGARHAVPESGGFDASEVLSLAAQLSEPGEDAVSLFAAPTMVRRLTDRADQASGPPGAGLKTVVYGGGPMYQADIIEAVDRMGPRFVQIYGQGESPMTLTALSRAAVADRTHPRWRERLASVGVAHSCMEIRIDAEDPETTGEILARGAAVADGYWRNPAATEATFCGGWLRTGDLGVLDADGFLTLRDRAKDVIISGGANIYPREVEEALLTHAAVREAAVIGKPDPEWGETVVAFVTPAPGAAPTPDALDAHCLARIARFKRPKAYRLVADLPKNNYGKVLKTTLREMLAAERDGEREWSD